MHEYPDSQKAMDLIAEHRLRTLHASAAWRAKHEARGNDTGSGAVASLGSKIEHVLEVVSINHESSASNSSTLP